jgi:two-component system, sensor histidine kinase and response regulator
MKRVTPSQDTTSLRSASYTAATRTPRAIVENPNAESDKQRVTALETEIALYRHMLEKSRDELQSFAYSVSHDLRAPIRAIEGFSKILAEDFAAQLQPDARKFLDHIISNTQQLSGQIEDLLRFFRAGRTPSGKSPLDPNAILNSVRQSIKVPVNVGIDQEQLPSVAADAGQLREIFSQLLSNALKAVAKAQNPRISIGSRVEPGVITYFVRDNGLGFDSNNAARLFQIFQKLHSPTDFPGNGVGLAIVRRMVEAQGGCVRAEGSPGAGATFYFSLPA